MKKMIGLLLVAIALNAAALAQDSTLKSPPPNQPAGQPATQTTNQPQEKKEHKPPIGIGIKGGVNFANVTNVSDVNGSHSTGWMIGAFFQPNSKGILGFRTELIYSKQGYNFAEGGTTGKVNLDYILLPQLFVINITRFFELHAGFQMAFLINAQADSSKPTSGSNPYAAVMDYYNRFDYGFCGGFEVKPFRRLFVGARYNASLNNRYKMPDSGSMTGQVPPFIPTSTDVNFKNNVIQLYAGLKF